MATPVWAVALQLRRTVLGNHYVTETVNGQVTGESRMIPPSMARLYQHFPKLMWDVRMKYGNFETNGDPHIDVVTVHEILPEHAYRPRLSFKAKYAGGVPSKNPMPGVLREDQWEAFYLYVTSPDETYVSLGKKYGRCANVVRTWTMRCARMFEKQIMERVPIDD